MLMYFVSATAVDRVVDRLNIHIADAEKITIIDKLEPSMQNLTDTELEAAIRQLPGEVPTERTAVIRHREIVAMH